MPGGQLLLWDPFVRAPDRPDLTQLGPLVPCRSQPRDMSWRRPLARSLTLRRCDCCPPSHLLFFSPGEVWLSSLWFRCYGADLLLLPSSETSLDASPKPSCLLNLFINRHCFYEHRPSRVGLAQFSPAQCFLSPAAATVVPSNDYDKPTVTSPEYYPTFQSSLAHLCLM